VLPRGKVGRGRGGRGGGKCNGTEGEEKKIFPPLHSAEHVLCRVAVAVMREGKISRKVRSRTIVVFRISNIGPSLKELQKVRKLRKSAAKRLAWTARRKGTAAAAEPPEERTVTKGVRTCEDQPRRRQGAGARKQSMTRRVSKRAAGLE